MQIRRGRVRWYWRDEWRRGSIPSLRLLCRSSRCGGWHVRSTQIGLQRPNDLLGDLLDQVRVQFTLRDGWAVKGIVHGVLDGLHVLNGRCTRVGARSARCGAVEWCREGLLLRFGGWRCDEGLLEGLHLAMLCRWLCLRLRLRLRLWWQRRRE